MARRAYLDWNATAPLRPQARVAMLAALEVVGNPSSVHREGREARAIIDAARHKVAALVGAEAADVIFTSGGTEANTLALAPRPQAAADRLLVSAIEHPSVRSGGRFAAQHVETIPVTERGSVDLAVLEQRLGVARAAREGASLLLSIMLANNESGIVQPIDAVAEMAHAAGALLHVDAVQAVGRIRCDMRALGADLMTVSAHKIGGPKGVGALVRRASAAGRLVAAITGGGQERGQRAGTENVIGIAGFGAAAAEAQAALETDAARIRTLRERLEAGLRRISPTAVIFGAEAERVPNTTLFAVPGVKAETAVIALDLEGVAVSSGAACSSGKVQPSHVLDAMGVPRELARGALRVSLGYSTDESQLERFLAAWLKFCGALHRDGRGMAA